ncbi:RNA methyltransferase, partial [Archangium sp.]|uniref:THUMP domain-containing class I SAM-dependent RNA methyltransferase n=1 Tax=Archangium sp. TaxID=1872627 RepID=UPI002ED7B928
MPLQVTNVQQREQVFVSALPGLEPAVEAEAEALGLSPRRVEGGVELTGEPGLHQEANLRLRTASRVLLRLGRFAAPDAGALTKGLAGLALGRVWDGKSAPRLSVALHGARLKGQDAVLAAAARAWGLPSVERAGPLDEESFEGLTLLVRLEGDTCTVSADTSGEPLHRRGYRQEVSRAPLRETLAAGILVLAGYDGVAPLVDPMCGSGTFLIEGAWMSQRRAPGLSRAFAFERFPGFDAAAWAARKARVEAEALPAPRAVLRGHDINAGSLGTARRNARRAGVTLTLERQDVRTLALPAGLGPGLVVANPPYGKRVGEAEDLPGLYRALGATFRRAFAGWRAAVLVPDDAGLVRALG